MKITFITLRWTLFCLIFINGQAFANDQGPFLSCLNSNWGHVNDSFARVKLDHPILSKYGQKSDQPGIKLSFKQANENRLSLVGGTNSWVEYFTLHEFDKTSKFANREEALNFCTDLAQYCKKTIFSGESSKEREENNNESFYTDVVVGWDNGLTYKYIIVLYDKQVVNQDGGKVTVKKAAYCPNYYWPYSREINIG